MLRSEVRRRGMTRCATTQAALAEAVGVTKQQIRKLEKAANAGDGTARLLIGMAAMQAQRAVGGGLQTDLEDFT